MAPLAEVDPSSGPGTLVVLLVFLGFHWFSLVFFVFSLVFLGFQSLWFSTISLVFLGFQSLWFSTSGSLDSSLTVIITASVAQDSALNAWQWSFHTSYFLGDLFSKRLFKRRVQGPVQRSKTLNKVFPKEFVGFRSQNVFFLRNL